LLTWNSYVDEVQDNLLSETLGKCRSTHMQPQSFTGNFVSSPGIMQRWEQLVLGRRYCTDNFNGEFIPVQPTERFSVSA
jgi:hypothetical protein